MITVSLSNEIPSRRNGSFSTRNSPKMSWHLWSLALWVSLLNFNFVHCLLPEKSHYHHPVHHIYWNSSNPIFTKAESNSNAINHLRSTPVLNAHLLDTIVIHCPHYHIRQFRDLTEQSTLYLVSKRSFDGCKLDSSSRLLGYCDQLNNDRTIHVTLKRRGSKLGKFLPGRNYFIITTSTGRADGLYQREAGLCVTKNMRLKIHILKEPYKTMKPVKFWMGSSREENDFIVSKQNDEEVLFMTEEFNELTWKKKLYDPRIPKFEQRHFDFSSPLIVASSRNRVSRKFPKTHKVEDKDQPVPFLMHHHEMRRLPKSLVMIDGSNDSHVTDNDYFNDRTVETKPRFRKIRHKKNKNGRFAISHEHFWPSEEPSTGKLVLQEINDDFDVASMNDITDKIELIRVDEYHQFNLDKKMRKIGERAKYQPSPEKLMFYDRPTDGIAPLLSGVEARRNTGNLLMPVMFFYFHVRRHLWTEWV